jgi:ribosomal protein S27AE
MFGDNYWSVTDDMIRKNGGRNPTCPNCGKEMYALDDHGRFACSCGRRIGEYLFKLPPISQVPPEIVAGMSNAEKARIPPIHRLHSPPTEAEAAFFAIARKGPDAMDDPAYWAASAAIERERGDA